MLKETIYEVHTSTTFDNEFLYVAFCLLLI